MLAAGRADVIANPAAWHGQYGGYMQVPKEMSASPFADNAMALWDAMSEGAQACTVTTRCASTFEPVRYPWAHRPAP